MERDQDGRGGTRRDSERQGETQRDVERLSKRRAGCETRTSLAAPGALARLHARQVPCLASPPRYPLPWHP